MDENMTFRISFLILVFSTWVNAQNRPAIPDKNWVNSYQSNVMHFVSQGSDYAAATPGRHSKWINLLMNKYLAWEPVDELSRPVGDCDIFKLKEGLRLSPDVRMRTQVFEQYYTRCSYLFKVGPKNPLEQALKLFSLKYNIDQNPFFHRVVFSLPDGQKLKGVFALKDSKRRPLVIVRAGVTGNVEEAYAERFFFYQLFERGLVNVLLVENMTSSDYIHFNKSFNFGGLAESYQNIWLAQTLRSPTQPISRLVQSVHLIGLSLGGQGVLTAAWLARYQADPKLFSSFMALCPLVNTTETFNHLFKTSLLRFPFELWARSRFVEFKKLKPELFKGYMGLPNRLLTAVAKNYKRPMASYLGVREPWFIQRQTDFYSLHELSKWDPTLRNPVWTWVTSDDLIVPVNLNADQMQIANPLRISEGHHCSFPVVWDGRVLSQIFMGHILGSTQFDVSEKQVKLDINPKLQWEISGIQFSDERQTIQVDLSAGGKTARSFMINRSDLDFAFRSSKLSEHEKFMIRRWLSSNLKLSSDTEGLSLVVSWPMVR